MPAYQTTKTETWFHFSVYQTTGFRIQVPYPTLQDSSPNSIPFHFSHQTDPKCHDIWRLYNTKICYPTTVDLYYWHFYDYPFCTRFLFLLFLFVGGTYVSKQKILDYMLHSGLEKGRASHGGGIILINTYQCHVYTSNALVLKKVMYTFYSTLRDIKTDICIIWT